MSSSLRWGPPPLLLLVLCWLLVYPTLGFPAGTRTSATRDLAESASGDDLISGRDFLSIFIGASLGPRSGRSRSINTRNKVDDDPEQSISSFGSRTLHRRRNSYQSTNDDESPDETASYLDNLSDSKVPSVEHDSVNSANIDNNPHPYATSRSAHIPIFHSEGIDGDSFEYSSDSAAESSVSIKTIAPKASETTKFLNSNSELHAVTPTVNIDEFTVVTDIVTSREEISSTEPLVDGESQDASTKVHAVVDFNEFNNNQHEDTIKEVNPSQVSSRNGKLSLSYPNTTPSTVMTYGVSTEAESTSLLKFPTSTTEASQVTLSTSPESSQSTVSPPIQQVISVRVSSSVVQGASSSPSLSRSKSNNHIDNVKTKLFRDGLAQTPMAPVSDEDMQSRIDTDAPTSTSQPTGSESEASIRSISDSQEGPTSLITEEQPAATAVQRSQFSVEEASPSSTDVASNQQGTPLFHHRTVATVVETTRNSQIRPVSYQTSISTATSDSRVHFYRERPHFHRQPSSVAETVQTSVVASHRGSMQANYEKTSGQPIENDENIPIETRMGRYGEPHHEVRISGPTDHASNFGSNHQQLQADSEISRNQKSIAGAHHQEPAEKNYELAERSYGKPERTYGVPEQNYEVDEAVSVMSNGRAHGIQTTTQSPVDPNPKIAYVMEGSNYRKYRVEERTSDGFIVGEYGVVSHDDGSLRGVRYTADGTINPRLIQEALVKFLNL